MGIPDTNFCFSTIDTSQGISCLGQDRCCCYEDSYHIYPTCCSCTTYWWIWALVAIFVLATATSILAMYLRRRKRIHGSRSGSEILFGSRSLFNDKYPLKFDDKDTKIDKGLKLPQRPYVALSGQNKFSAPSEYDKNYLPPQDPKYLPPNDKKYIPPQDLNYNPVKDQRYLPPIQNQKPIPPPISQPLYIPPPQDYKYPPSTGQIYIPSQQYMAQSSDPKYVPGANKYDSRDLGYRRQQEYEKQYVKHDQREVEKALGKGSEGDLANYQHMDKRDE